MKSDELDENNLPQRTFIFTTNVDSMFDRCHFSSVYNVHGTYEQWQCSGLNLDSNSWKKFDNKPCCSKTWFLEKNSALDVEQPPTCVFCGVRPARPAVYMFGDTLFCEHKSNAANFSCFKEAVAMMCQQDVDISVVLLEIGAGIRLPRVCV